MSLNSILFAYFRFFFFFISAKCEEKFENWTKEKERMDARIDYVEPLRVV